MEGGIDMGGLVSQEEGLKFDSRSVEGTFMSRHVDLKLLFECVLVIYW